MKIRNTTVQINKTRSGNLTEEQIVTGLTPSSYEVLIFDYYYLLLTCLQENITSRWDMHCMSATGTSNNIASTTGDISLDNCFIMWSLRTDHYTCADVA